MVCCNLCIATDRLKDDLKVCSVDELKSKITIQRPPNNFFDSFLIQQMSHHHQDSDH